MTTTTFNIATPSNMATWPLFATAARKGVKGRRPSPPPPLDMGKVKHAVARFTLEEKTREEDRANGWPKLVVRKKLLGSGPVDAARRRYMSGGLGDHARTDWDRPEFCHED